MDCIFPHVCYIISITSLRKNQRRPFEIIVMEIPLRFCDVIIVPATLRISSNTNITCLGRARTYDFEIPAFIYVCIQFHPMQLLHLTFKFDVLFLQMKDYNQ